MERSEGARIVHRFFDGTGATYDRVVRLCTYGADTWWKHSMLGRIPKGSKTILDQACGTGILTIKIARRFPLCRVTGVDMEEEYLAVARKKVLLLGLTNVDFIAGRAEDVFLDRHFDCICSSYLAKYADLNVLVARAKSMLREGGRVIMHDFTYPRIRAFVAVWRLHFVLLQTVGPRLYPEWQPAFDGLPALLSQSTWVEDLAALLQANGFSNINVDSLSFGAAAIVTGKKATED